MTTRNTSRRHASRSDRPPQAKKPTNEVLRFLKEGSIQKAIHVALRGNYVVSSEEILTLLPVLLKNKVGYADKIQRLVDRADSDDFGRDEWSRLCRVINEAQPHTINFTGKAKPQPPSTFVDTEARTF